MSLGNTKIKPALQIKHGSRKEHIPWTLSNRSCPKYNRPLAIKETHQRLTQNIHHQHTFSDVADMNSAIHIGRFLRPGLTFLKVWHGLKAY